MASPRTSIRSTRGLTLVEILVVLGIMAIVGSFGIIVGLDSYRSHLFYTDRALLVTALQRARAEAIGNICNGPSCVDGKPHGVFIEENGNGEVTAFVVFQGPDYATRDAAFDERFATRSVIRASGISSTTFAQLSGDVSPGAVGEIGLYGDPGRVSTTTIGAEGQIFWNK